MLYVGGWPSDFVDLLNSKANLGEVGDRNFMRSLVLMAP